NVTLGKTGNYIFNYVYNYTDHLGNVRLSYTKDPTNNELKILEENHYYPFGMKHQVYSAASIMKYKLDNTNPLDDIAKPGYTTSTDYNYKYNGFEYQDELGLGLYDYGARMYDPALGRWHVIDPLAEVSRRHSPYNYAFNNPLRYIDPDGMMPEDVIITGALKQEAFDQLQSSVGGQLNLTMDENGMVCYERTDMNGPLTQGAQDLMNAIDDTTITSTVDASDNDFVSTGQGPLLGNFMGNEFTGEGPIFTVDAKQEVNPIALKNFDEAAGATVGTNMLHETTEAYRGGLISKQTGVEAKVNSSIYEKAHSQSTPQAGHPTPPTEHFFDAKGTEIYRGRDGRVIGTPVKLEYRFNGTTFHTVPKSK
ncbi:MAG: RHS repeat-associated core domain-containing protein, partial [Moheibacter sp.]